MCLSMCLSDYLYAFLSICLSVYLDGSVYEPTNVMKLHKSLLQGISSRKTRVFPSVYPKRTAIRPVLDHVQQKDTHDRSYNGAFRVPRPDMGKFLCP